MDSFTVFDASYTDGAIREYIDSGKVFYASDAPILLKWAELTRWLTDIHQLFDVYRWNGTQLALVPMYASGKLYDLPHDETLESCRIKLNAITMNIVNSGVNLVDAMEAFAKHFSKNEWARPDCFHDEVGKVIEGNLSYSLMDGFRNYASHGQLLVSTYLEPDGSWRAAFDLEQLRQPVFIKEKPRVKEQLKAASISLSQIENGPHYLSYCAIMDNFLVAVADLYAKWLELYQPLAESVVREVSALYRDNSEKLHEHSDGGVFSIVVEDSTGHIMEGSPQTAMDYYLDRVKLANSCKQQANASLKETMKSFKSVEHPGRL